MRTAVIIAGGRSTRFGDADKATADLAGTPMIRRVGDRLVGVVDELVVNCRADQRAAVLEAFEGYPHPVSIVEDETPDEGPMSGIRTGLRAASGEYAVVVACDMPFVDPGVISYLFERVEEHDAAVPQLEDKWFQTTHAVYRAEAMADACDEALAEGARKIIDPLFELDYVVVDESAVSEHGRLRTFENLNTREEFEEAADELASGDNRI
ncbi:molybdenum cofactor guanylyltransferase [Haloprofundus marisrubri]|uniref:Probable molybdenum cofactor guanylyltransferase n=1 Tax=Haloprofundus marisrubri TaxID=1514971 RepID=A0A0W1R7B8_9EURY|nr:molybdenum cofactor guanylyltransferase [Haloprofundus marisrubri]KTG09104.1 molybdenum cofactor guanylyltransferase [Haloprofundus marisrubri]